LPTAHAGSGAIYRANVKQRIRSNKRNKLRRYQVVPVSEKRVTINGDPMAQLQGFVGCAFFAHLDTSSPSMALCQSVKPLICQPHMLVAARFIAQI